MAVNKDFIDFNEIFMHIGTMCLVIDYEGNIIKINNSMLNILKYSESEILNRNIKLICLGQVIESILDDTKDNVVVSLITKSGHIATLNTKVIYKNTTDNKFFVLQFSEEEISNRVDGYNAMNSFIYSDIYAFCIKDLDGRYVFVNSLFEKLFHRPKEHFLGKTDYEVWETDEKYKWRKQDVHIVNTNETYKCCESLIIDGEPLYYDIRKSPIKNRNGEIAGVYCVIKDLTNEMRLKNDILIQREQLAILYRITSSSLSTDFSDMFNYLSETLELMLNINWFTIYIKNEETNELEYYTSRGISDKYYEAQIKTKNNIKYLKRIYEENKSIPMQKIDNNLYLKEINFEQEDIVHIANYPLKCKGESIGIINYGSREEDYSYNWDNKFIETVSNSIALLIQHINMKDNLIAKLNEEKANRQKIDLFFNTTLDFFCLLQRDGSFIKIGRHMQNAFSLTDEEISTLKFQDLLSSDTVEYIVERKWFFEDVSRKINVSMQWKDMEPVFVEWNTEYISSKSIYVLSGRNMTDKEKIKENKDLMDEYAKISRIKSDFLSNVSHELRTPVSIMELAINLMEGRINMHDIEDEKLTEYIGKIRKNASRLSRLVYNYLDIATEDSGFMNYDSRVYDIVSYTKDIFSSLKIYLKEFNASLSYEVNLDKCLIRFDKNKFVRVILNLVSNSVKFARLDVQPKIMVKIYVEDNEVCLIVSDNGIGLSENNLVYMFDKFRQLEDIMTRTTEGSGIGLYIVKMFLKHDNATITAKNNEIGGAEFTIKFPKLSDEELLECRPEKIEYYRVIKDDFDREFSDI